MSIYAEKTREARLRRAFYRRGYRLVKSRERNPSSLGYGGYMIVDIDTNFVIAGGSPWLYSLSDLDEVEAWLN